MGGMSFPSPPEVPLLLKQNRIAEKKFKQEAGEKQNWSAPDDEIRDGLRAQNWGAISVSYSSDERQDIFVGDHRNFWLERLPIRVAIEIEMLSFIYAILLNGEWNLFLVYINTQNLI